MGGGPSGGVMVAILARTRDHARLPHRQPRAGSGRSGHGRPDRPDRTPRLRRPQPSAFEALARSTAPPAARRGGARHLHPLPGSGPRGRFHPPRSSPSRSRRCAPGPVGHQGGPDPGPRHPGSGGGSCGCAGCPACPTRPSSNGWSPCAAGGVDGPDVPHLPAPPARRVASGDLGVRKGFALAHGSIPCPLQPSWPSRVTASRTYRSIAAWYCWRATDTITP